MARDQSHDRTCRGCHLNHMDNMETTIEERESKLQAGKDALLAFQKKKDKKVKKKKQPKANLTLGRSEPMESSLDYSTVTNESIAESDFINPGITNGISMDNHSQTTDDDINKPHPHNDANLSTTLVAMETTLSNREKEIEELKSQHISEVDSLLIQQEKIREELLKEQELKFTKEINEMKEQMSTTATHDDEMEAVRLRQIKNKLKQIHEEEMENVQLTHQQEKAVLRDEYQRKMEEMTAICEEKLESNKKRLEEIANDQIKEIHAQFMTSYNEITTQKNKVEEENRKVQERLHLAEDEVAKINKEKTALSVKVNELEKNHMMEVGAVRDESSKLEQRLQKWKEKASQLQQRIEETEKPQPSTPHLEDQLHQMEKQHEQTIEEHKTTIRELKAQLNEEKQSFEEKLLEIEDQHQSMLNQMEVQHSEQLENSLSESTTQAASLEFAEVHMKELQQQLNAYRNQEMNHKTALENAREEQLRQVEMMKQIGEEKCERLTAKYNEELKCSQKKIKELEENIKSQEDKMAEQTVELKMIVDRAVDECTKTLNDQHQQEIEESEIIHKEEMVRIEEEKHKMETEKQEEIERMHRQYETTLTQLKDAKEENEKQVKSHDLVTMSSEDKVKEVRTLQERVHKLETEFRAKEVHLSLTESELTNEQVKHLQTKELLELSTKKCDDITIAMKGLKKELEDERETSMKRFEEMLQVKEDEVATHQSHLAASQLRITELTKELAEERKISESLKNDMAAMSSNNQQHVSNTTSELTKVHNELKQAKERCDTLVEEWKEKENDAEKLKNQLSTVQDNLANQNADHMKVVQGLKTQVADLSNQVATTRKENETLTNQIQELTRQKNELSQEENVARSRVQTLEDELGIQRNEHKELLTKTRTLEKTLQELQTSNENTLNELQEERDHLALKTTEASELLAKVNELELQLLKDSDESHRYEDLELKLKTAQNLLRKSNEEHQRELSQAEERYMALESRFNKTQKIESKMNTLLSSQSDVEKSLVKARQVLIEKLRQKELLEKDLNHHRTQLERRQSEKQRLEELLFEKSRFEQELRNQREQLQFDLNTIEKKMKSSNANGPDEDDL